MFQRPEVIPLVRCGFDTFLQQFSGTEGINHCNLAVICFHYVKNTANLLQFYLQKECIKNKLHLAKGIT